MGGVQVIKVFVSIGLAALLAACSTTYGEMGLTGGVEAAAVTNDVYRISARGNGFTDATTVQDYSLLKAAETAIIAGETHFAVLSDRNATRTSVGQTAGSMRTQVYGNTAFSTYTPGYTYDIVKPGEDLMIRVYTPRHNEPLPSNAFNAQEVFNAINPRIKRSKS